VLVESSPTRGTPIPSAAAILHTLIPGSSSTLFNMQTSQKLAHISQGFDFWIYVDWNPFANLSQSYTPLNPVTHLFKTCIWIILETMSIRIYS
jgi:hypothetical protein